MILFLPFDLQIFQWGWLNNRRRPILWTFMDFMAAHAREGQWLPLFDKFVLGLVSWLLCGTIYLNYAFFWAKGILLPETCSIAGALLSTLVPSWDLHFDLRKGSESGHSPARLRRLHVANLLHGPCFQTCLCNRCHRRRWQRRPCWCKSAVPYWAARKFHIHRALSDVSISFDFVMLWWKMIVENVVWTVMIVPHIVVWGSCFQFCIPFAASSSSSAPPAVTTFHTQLCHIQLCHTIFVTHDSFTHNFVTHKSHTRTTLSHITLSHTTLSHTSSSHTSLSHTTISHIQLCHTQLFHIQLCHTTF